MRIKGKNQHVIPNDTGWYVVDEANQMVVQHFNSQKEALEYARKCACNGEGEVLVHASPCEDLRNISTVTLPQREYFPGQGYVDMTETSITAQGETIRIEEGRAVMAGNLVDKDYDSILEAEAYYYDL